MGQYILVEKDSKVMQKFWKCKCCLEVLLPIFLCAVFFRTFDIWNDRNKVLELEKNG